jgi:hypothetical protein
VKEKKKSKTKAITNTPLSNINALSNTPLGDFLPLAP